MAPIDLPPVDVWLPAKPAIIRPAGDIVVPSVPAIFGPPPFIKAGGFELVFVASGLTTGSANPIVSPTISFGAAAADRHVLAAFGAGVNTIEVSSVTIGGVSATRHVRVGTVETWSCEIWGADVPTGTSGVVSVTSTGSRASLATGIYRMVGHASTTPTATDQAQNSAITSETNTITINAGGGCLAVCVLRDTADISTIDWTNLGDAAGDFQHSDISAADDCVSASTETFATLQTSRVITGTASAGTPQQMFMCSAAWA